MRGSQIKTGQTPKRAIEHLPQKESTKLEDKMVKHILEEASEFLTELHIYQVFKQYLYTCFSYHHRLCEEAEPRDQLA